MTQRGIHTEMGRILQSSLQSTTYYSIMGQLVGFSSCVPHSRTRLVVALSYCFHDYQGRKKCSDCTWALKVSNKGDVSLLISFHWSKQITWLHPISRMGEVGFCHVPGRRTRHLENSIGDHHEHLLSAYSMPCHIRMLPQTILTSL